MDLDALSGMWRLDATSLAATVRSGEVTATEVCEATLHRIDELDGSFNAFCTIDRTGALAAASEIDRMIGEGEDPGPLAGVPVGVKDLISTKGLRTTFGSWHFKDHVPEDDDIAVARLRKAGAVIIGKTTTSEFGYAAVGNNDLFPTPKNPHDPAATTGGSSAGSGSAVSYGAVPIALGSDGGGSIRIPAAMCGVVGFKASMGRIPVWPGCKDERYPGISSWDALEHIGPLARTVDDIHTSMMAMSGPDARDRFSLPGNPFTVPLSHGWLVGKTIGVSYDFGFVAVHQEVRACLEGVVSMIADEFGCRIIERDPGFEDPLPSFRALIASETDLEGMRELAEKHAFASYVMDLIDHPHTAEDMTRARKMRQQVCRKMATYMAEVDLMLTPTSPFPAFSVEELLTRDMDLVRVKLSHWLSMCNPMNLTGQPAISMTAGYTSQRLPIGIQIVGRHLEDVEVLAAAYDLERALPVALWPPDFRT